MTKYTSELIFTDEGKVFKQEHSCDLRILYKSGSTIIRCARHNAYPVRFIVYDVNTGEPLLKFYCRRRSANLGKGYVCRLSRHCKYGGEHGMWF